MRRAHRRAALRDPVRAGEQRDRQQGLLCLPRLNILETKDAHGTKQWLTTAES